MDRRFIFFIAGVILAFTPINSFSQTVSFEEPVKYKTLSDSGFRDLKPSDSLVLKKGDSALIVTKQSMPMLLFAPLDSDSKVKVSAANLEAALQEQIQSNVNTVVNDVVDGIRRTEVLVRKREYSQALAAISTLKSKFPQVSSVLFLSATVQYLNNNKSGAIDDLKKGLAIDPTSQPAQTLLSELKGGAP